MLCCWMVCLYIVVGLTYSRSPVFNTRDAVLFRAPEPPGFVRQTPEAPALIAFRRHLGDLIQPTTSSLETARALRTWSYRQQPHTWDMLNGGDGEDSVDPELLLAQQQRGVPGACRRFAYVYLGALLSAGLNARVVNWDSSFYDRDPRAHSLVEVRIEELHRWVMMDAMSDQESLVDGRPASLIEPRALMDACASPSRGAARRRQWGAFVRPARTGPSARRLSHSAARSIRTSCTRTAIAPTWWTHPLRAAWESGRSLPFTDIPAGAGGTGRTNCFSG